MKEHERQLEQFRCYEAAIAAVYSALHRWMGSPWKLRCCTEINQWTRGDMGWEHFGFAFPIQRWRAFLLSLVILTNITVAFISQYFDDIMGVAIFNLGAIMTCVDGNDSSTTRDTGTNIAWGIFEYYTFFLDRNQDSRNGSGSIFPAFSRLSSAVTATGRGIMATRLMQL